jgi:hypothetical protein
MRARLYIGPRVRSGFPTRCVGYRGNVAARDSVKQEAFVDVTNLTNNRGHHFGVAPANGNLRAATHGVWRVAFHVRLKRRVRHTAGLPPAAQINAEELEQLRAQKLFW